MRTRGGAALVLGPLGLVSLLALAVLIVEGLMPGDAVVSDLLRSTGGLVWRWLSQLGSGAVLYPVLLGAGAFHWARRGDLRTALLPTAVLVAAQAIEAVAFVTLERPAPTGLGAVGFSSGHAMTAVLGWGLLARSLGVTAWPLVGAAGLVVGASRVAQGVHWPTDVVAGALVGSRSGARRPRGPVAPF
jgi:membrane-associated phospholipid phosphatase